MRKTLILLVVLMMVFAFTIPASAGGNGTGGGIGPGDGTGPVGGLGPIGGICPDGNGPGGGIGPGDGTGPVGDLGPFGGNGNGGKGPGSGIGPGDGTGPIGGLGPFGGNGNGGKGSTSSQGQQGPRINFTINGEIFAIGTDTVTITMACGNKTAQIYIGSQVTVTVTPLTRYNSEIGTIDFPVQFSDLQIGQLVSLNGTVVESVWKVRRITVVTALDCLP
jgi:hypothetical protein